MKNVWFACSFFRSICRAQRTILFVMQCKLADPFSDQQEKEIFSLSIHCCIGIVSFRESFNPFSFRSRSLRGEMLNTYTCSAGKCVCVCVCVFGMQEPTDCPLAILCCVTSRCRYGRHIERMLMFSQWIIIAVLLQQNFGENTRIKAGRDGTGSAFVCYQIANWGEWKIFHVAINGNERNVCVVNCGDGWCFCLPLFWRLSNVQRWTTQTNRNARGNRTTHFIRRHFGLSSGGLPSDAIEKHGK